MTASRYLGLVTGAAGALKDRKEEVNRLNVFPVPDGDTGTNMSLTMDVVVQEVGKLPADADAAALCHAVTHGSLMGARGNSGVILSQILRGLCEAVSTAETIDTELLASALERSVTVAFQAVRKPVEGTILTVLHDTAIAARTLADDGVPLSEALPAAVTASFDSVRRTPELLQVLKDNAVVDAGGFGLAILFEGFVAAALGTSVHVADVSVRSEPLAVVPVDDWNDSEYLYCTEFLLYGDNVDSAEVGDYISSVGGSELVVGSDGEYKIHVHTNDPGSVLAHMTSLGEVAEVHVNNMRRQTAARDALLAETPSPAPNATALKPVGFVAVAAGSGMADILKSLGVDVVVSGGQTMNPSTQDLADAIARVPAQKVVVLPNNKNIIMAANAATSVAAKPSAVVPTTTVPQAFSAMLAYDGSDDLDSIVSTMSSAAQRVRTGEVTTAIKDAKGKVGAIKAGQVIGIIDHEIEVVGDEVDDVARRLSDRLLAHGAETLTILSGEGFGDEQLKALAADVQSAHSDIDIDTQRGEQPLYLVIMAAE